MQMQRIIKQRFCKLITSSAVVFSLGVSLPLFAKGDMMPPDQVVMQATEEVLEAITLRREELQADKAKLYALVHEIILPNMDFHRISRAILGKHWRTATPEQQRQFTEEFTALLIRTYAIALFEYTDQKIIFKPLKVAEGDDRVSVKAEFVPKDGPKVPFSYSLTNRDDTRWRVYDIKIDGVSLVTNYRTSYGNIIRTDGVDGLINALRNKNVNSVAQTSH
jgi:phospholipid transport system substrate-binding protein